MEAFLVHCGLKTTIDHWYRVHVKSEREEQKFENDKRTLTVLPKSFDEDQPQEPLRLYESLYTSTEDSPKLDNFGVPRFFGIERYGQPTENPRFFDNVECWPDNIKFYGELDTVRLQPQVVEKIVGICEESRRRNRVGGGIICLPPGYGKTVIALKIASELKLRTLFIVHRTRLYEQICERAGQFVPGASVGRIQQSTWDTDKDIVVASIQTLVSKKSRNDVAADMREKMKSFGLVFIDEAHHIGARTFSRVFQILPCPLIFGLTATPHRADGLTKVLHWFLGPMLFSVDDEKQKSISSSRNLQISIERIKFEHGKKRSRDDENDLFLEEKTPSFGRKYLVGTYRRMIWNKRRNQVIAEWIRRKFQQDDGNKCLVLSKRIDHLINIGHILEKFQLEKTIAYCTSRQRKKVRQTAFEADVILSTYEMCGEGVDSPDITLLVLGMPAGNTEQVIGRLDRGEGSKVVMDIWDTNLHPVFDGMARKRLNLYGKKDWDVSYKRVV